MELHQVLELFYLSGNVVRKELREGRLIVTVVLILDNHKISVLLQVLHLGANQIFVTFDPNHGDSFIAHVTYNLKHQLLELLLFLSLMLFDKSRFPIKITTLESLRIIHVINCFTFFLVRRLLSLWD